MGRQAVCSVQSLKRFQTLNESEFQSNPDHYRIAYYDLHVALEACLDIGAHLRSRIPGQKPKTYKDIPLLLSENSLMPGPFVTEKLIPMAGYRDRMTHFYHRLKATEILEIIKSRLGDFEEFSRHVRQILMAPERFGFPATSDNG